MKKRVVLATVVSGDSFERLHAITGPMQRAYAERHGWQYRVIGSSVRSWPSPAWWKLECCDWLRDGDYDAVVFMDADAWPWPDAGNILDVVPEGKFGAFDSFSLPYMRMRNGLAMQSWQRWCQESNNADQVNAPFEHNRYVNSGVWVCWWAAAPALQCWNAVEGGRYYEQHQINLNLYQMPERFIALDRVWNMGHSEPMMTGHGVQIAHLNGIRKDLSETAESLIARWHAKHDPITGGQGG